jgi:hypothetical protein
VSVDQLGRAIVLGRDRAETPDTTTPVQWAIGIGLLGWLVWFVVMRLARPRAADVLTVTQGVVEALFVISIWARSAPPAIYTPGVEFVLLAASVAAGGVQATRTLGTRETTRFTGGRSRVKIVIASAQIVLFGALAIGLW